MTLLNCLIIDDEPLAREGLEDYLREIDFLRLAGSCENPLEALPIMDMQIIDLIFLDIQMPKLTGLEFLRSITKPPLIILTTAFPSFALEGFQLNVLDYLVKPITFERFFNAAQKAKKQAELIRKTAPATDETAPYFFVKCDHKFEKIRFDELRFVESMQNYVNLHTDRGKFTVLLPLKNIARELPPERFLQVHKSFIIAVDRIESLEGNQLMVGNRLVPVSRANREAVMNLVNQHLIRR